MKIGIKSEIHECTIELTKYLGEFNSLRYQNVTLKEKKGNHSKYQQ
jgi:hypothetical protein